MGWWFYAESFLSVTDKLPAEILVVEGWIGSEGIQSAALEFQRGRYQYVVAAGGFPLARFGPQPSYAESAGYQLMKLGVPADKVIVAISKTTARQRTFESAAAVWLVLRSKEIRPNAINVLTLGAHARRSRSVFSKVYGSDTHIGVISWIPVEYGTAYWWNSSERTKDLIAETVGESIEFLFDSGRASNVPSPFPANTTKE